ncbi:MAG TPA: formate dehydrogenase subunit gamma [Candidatus Angelobacter sp.]|jgi:formate dehydrogenase subunit gamma|nr:formate dehydrogenase subunit gamma [Candidatus Angelobacter sp.]
MSGGTIARPTTAVPENEVVRYTFIERAYHWINAFAYTYLLLTGLALFTPFLWWIAYMLGGGGTIRFWHPWVGLVYFVTILWMHSKWKSDMKAIPQDQQWSKNIKAYVQNQDEAMPPQGRFNAGQKQFWVVMFYCTFILLITGVIMWFPEKMPREEHWVLSLVVFLHSVTALITIAAFIVHVYMSVWVTPGSVKAMTHGVVSTNWAKTHHRLWYEKITGRKS